MDYEETRNRVLLALPVELREQILRHCLRVEFPSGHIIYEVGTPVEHVYFVDSGLVSLIKTMDDGRSTQIGAVGTEGLVGVFAANNLNRPLVDYTVQIPVAAFRMNLAALQNEMSKNALLSRLMQISLFLHVDRIAQTAACSRLHPLEQRLCRWLLVAHDNAISDDFSLTHEFLAPLLGVQRPSMSMAANALQKRGLIRYLHGRITILDRAALERDSCGCYWAVRKEIDTLLEAR